MWERIAPVTLAIGLQVTGQPPGPVDAASVERALVQLNASLAEVNPTPEVMKQLVQAHAGTRAAVQRGSFAEGLQWTRHALELLGSTSGAAEREGQNVAGDGSAGVRAMEASATEAFRRVDTLLLSAQRSDSARLSFGLLRSRFETLSGEARLDANGPAFAKAQECLRQINELCELVQSEPSRLFPKGGEAHRIVRVGEAEIPVRTYIPSSAKQGEAIPVLVAIGGAGSDEHSFLEKYCGDALKDESERRGFAVVSPRLESVLMQPDAVAQVVKQLCLESGVMCGPVFLLGYSMGARACAQIIDAEPQLCAAWVSLAGTGGFPRTKNQPPALLCVGSADHLVRAAQLRTTVESKGLSDRVTVKEIGGLCHYLIVAAEVNESIAWLHERHDGKRPQSTNELQRESHLKVSDPHK